MRHVDLYTQRLSQEEGLVKADMSPIRELYNMEGEVRNMGPSTVKNWKREGRVLLDNVHGKQKHHSLDTAVSLSKDSVCVGVSEVEDFSAVAQTLSSNTSTSQQAWSLKAGARNDTPMEGASSIACAMKACGGPVMEVDVHQP